MSQLPRVVIILVNWNGYNDTVACLESLKRLYYSNYSIIIVDNNSADDSETKLRQNYPQHTVLQSSSNVGFAGGCNLGIQHALRGNCDYVLLLNNDTEVEPNLIGELVQIADSDEKIGIAGGKIYFTTPRNRIWSYGGKFNVNTGASKHFESEEQASREPIEAPSYLYLPGCLMLIKRKCVEDIGLLSEKFFHLIEDAEYCLRAERKGWKLALTPHAVIYHKVSASMELLSPIYNYYSQRNRLLLMREYGALGKSFLLHPGDILVAVLRIFLSMILVPKPSYLIQNVKLVIMAVRDFFTGRTGKRF